MSFRVTIDKVGKRVIRVRCLDLDECLDVVQVSHRDAPTGSELVLEELHGRTWYTTVIWTRKPGRWQRQMLSAGRSEAATVRRNVARIERAMGAT